LKLGINKTPLVLLYRRLHAAVLQQSWGIFIDASVNTSLTGLDKGWKGNWF